MTAGEMRKLLEDPEIGDEVQIVVPSPDHEYRRAYASVVTALDHGDDLYYTQDPGDSDPLDVETYGPVVTVLLVG